MTSQGSAPARFRRALATGNVLLVTATAAEMPRLSLGDALGVLLVFARAGDERAERAAVRWAARYCQEVRPTPNGEEATLVLASVRSLAVGGASARAGRKALHELAQARGLRAVSAALDELAPAD